MKRIALWMALMGCVQACGTAAKLPATPECLKYLACAGKLIPTQITTEISTFYGEGGDCWATQKNADQCTTNCLNGLSDLAKDSQFSATVQCQ